jgi:hypothetical protein
MTAQLACKLNRSWGANREKPGPALIRHALHCRETWRDIEFLERAFQKVYVSAADTPELVGIQA